jgi:hypothetical protein
MNTGGLFNRLRQLRIVVVLLALLLAYGAVSYSPRAATFPTYSVDLGGVTGSTNNTVLAYGRYVLVAPFWPSKGVDAEGELDLTQLDNYFIYVIDTKKPNSKPFAKELTTANGAKTIYFPTRVQFDPQSNNVYVRGTRFEEKEGNVTPIDVIAYVHLNLDDNGKPVFDSTVVPIDIQGVSTQFTGEAPLDFGFGADGELMVFTNGASVFSYNLDQGYLYKADIVHPSLYGPDDSISFLDVDPVSNVVSVCENRKSVDKENVATVTSEISFYRLGEKGTLDLMKRVFSDELPIGTSLTSGSNISIVSDGDVSFALSPLLVQYDAAKRTIGVVKPGFTVLISRPTNGRRGRISRPTNLHINSTPILAMARLGKKNKVVSAHSFADEFKDEGGLTEFVNGENSQWLISTWAGSLYSVDVASDLPESALRVVGQVGSRVERIDYYSKRSTVVAINSFALEDEGMEVAVPGSLVVGRMSDPNGFGGAVLQSLLPTAAALGRPTPSIRRPCNIKR